MNKTKSTYRNEENNLIEDIVNPDRVKERIANSYQQEIVKLTPTSSNWTKQNITIN